jgi:hypothetical protein
MSMEPEALGQRLADIEFPEAGTLAARVIGRYRAEGLKGSGRPRSRRRRLVPAAAVAAALLVAIVAGSGLVQAATGEPVLSDSVVRMLEKLGISASRDGVTPLAVSSESAGYSIGVVAGYADSTQTVVVVQVSRSGSAPAYLTPAAPVLLDGTGATLRSDGVAPSSAGFRVLVFDPIPHPGVTANALTLHIDTLNDFGASKGSGGLLRQIHGDWTLRFRLAYENDAAPTPAGGRLGRVTVTFTAVAATSNSVHVRFTTDGATIDQLFDLPPASGRGQFQYELLGPDGTQMGDFMNGNPSGKGPGSEGVTRVEWDILYTREGPGTYRLVLSWNGSRLERDVRVG